MPCRVEAVSVGWWCFVRIRSKISEISKNHLVSLVELIDVMRGCCKNTASELYISCSCICKYRDGISENKLILPRN